MHHQKAVLCFYLNGMIEQNVLREKTEVRIQENIKIRRRDICMSSLEKCLFSLKNKKFKKKKKEEEEEKETEWVHQRCHREEPGKQKKKGKKWFHGNQKDERVFRNGGKCVFIFYFIFSLQFMLLTFIHLFFLVKNDDHFSFWDDFDLMFTLYRKKLSHNLLNLKQILLILAAVTQDYNIRKSGFSLKLDLLPSYSFE